MHSRTPLETAPSQGTLEPPVRVKLAYGLGFIPQAAGFDTALGFVFFYYTAVLGLSGAMVGAASAIGLAFDALIDPFIGSVSDNTQSRLGRRIPVMILAIPFVALSMGLLFSPPGGAPQWLLFAWLAVTSVVVRASISAFNVPFIALGAEMSHTTIGRANLIAYRTITGLLAAVSISAAGYAVFFAGKGGLQKASTYPAFGWTVALVLAVGMIGCCLGIWRFAAALPQPARDTTPLWRRMSGEIGEVFRNRSFITLFTSAILLYAAIGLNATLNNHAFVFIWGLQPQKIAFIGYGYVLGILMGVLLAPRLQGRFEKKTLVIVGVGMLLASWTVLQSLRALGLFTVTGDAALWPQILSSGFAGIGTGLALIAYPAMMADAADEHELLFGRRREGLYFAGLGFANKAATGVGVLVAGVALDLIGFPKGNHTSAILPPDLLVRLVIIWGPVAAVLGVASLVLLVPYNITHRRHEELAAQLRLRRVE